MPYGYATLEVDQGEDWSMQVVLQDQWENALTVDRPLQMDIKDILGQLILSLSVPDDPIPDNVVPEMNFSADNGMIQIHIDRNQTAALDPGVYFYDIFVGVNDGDVYAGNQRVRALAGRLLVNKRITTIA
jgi:hypothetical protein